MRGEYPEPWRVVDKDLALQFLKKMFPEMKDLYTDHGDKFRGREAVWVGLRDNRDREAHQQRLQLMADHLKQKKIPFRFDPRQRVLFLVDDLQRDVLR